MEVDLHVTNRCNLYCRHCVYMSGDLKMKDLTLADVERFYPDLLEMKVEEVHLTGGEPLLNPEIFDIIAFLHTHGYKIRIQTNGVLINQKAAERLKELGVDHILISIDGLKEKHNAFRDNINSFDSAISAVQISIEKKIYTRVNTVLYQDNLCDIDGLLKLTSKIGVDQHSFFYLTPIGRGKNLAHKVLTLEEWKTTKEHIISIAKQLNFVEKVKIQDVFQEQMFKNSHCRLHYRDNCLILSNGDVFPCVFFVHSPFKLGNIHENNLLQIWENNQAWKQYFVIRDKKCSSSKCSGGCQGLAYLLSDSLSPCDPRCRPQKKLIPGCIRRYVVSE